MVSISGGLQNNEDRCRLLDNLHEDIEPNLEILPTTAIYVVCDGYNGDQCAKFVCSELPGLIKQCPHFESLDVPADEALLLSVLSAIEKVDAQFMKEPSFPDDSGCSLVVCILRGDLICVAWVGDCQMGLVSSDGKMTIVTNPHRAMTNVAEYDRILATSGKDWEGQVDAAGKMMGILQPCRAIGDQSFKERFPGLLLSTPQVSIFRFCPETHGDNPVIVLGSHALWETVSLEKLTLMASTAEGNSHSVQSTATGIMKVARDTFIANPTCEMVWPPEDLTVVICRPVITPEEV